MLIKPNWSITLTSADPVARFAAAELRDTLQRMGAPPLPIVEHAAIQYIMLNHGDEWDGEGFSREIDRNGLLLHGNGPRGLLYAVYDLLETLGCRWVAPGQAGERLPYFEQVVLPSDAVTQQPTLPGRSLIIGHDFFLHEAANWIVWAGRNRLNTLFIHTIDEPLALGACHLAGWRKRRKHLLPLLHQRGIALELGGHGMRALVPRAFFRSAPDAFRHNGTRRTPDHNFCPTSSRAQALLRANGATFFRAYPEASVLHLWPDDILGDGWCRCEQCASLSPSDQALLATNVLAETLATINPSARIAYLSYHDTTAAPTQVRPHPNIVLTFAPRSRSYGHSIGDSSSAVNVPYMRDLAANIEWFEEDSRQSALGSQQGTREKAEEAARHETRDTTQDTQNALAHSSLITHHSSLITGPRIFEYYLDGLLFKSTPPPLAQVLPGDLAAYAGSGTHTVGTLMTGDRPWLAAPLNAFLFARLAWNPAQGASGVLVMYAAARAPHASEALVQAYESLAAAWQPALAIVPGETTQFFARNLITAPPTDVLDYMAAPRLLRERRLERIERGLEHLIIARQAWHDVCSLVATESALYAERSECELSMFQLAFTAQRQRLYVLEGRGATGTTLRAALEAAQAALDAVTDWGTKLLQSPRARTNFALLHQFSQLQLDAVRHRHFLGPLDRVRLTAHVYSRIGVLLVRLRRYQQ